MRQVRAAPAVLLVAAAAVLLAGPGVGRAHETRPVGENEVVVGWLDEPAFAGFKNAVQVQVRAGGAPVEGAELEVVVLFGGPDAEERTDPMPLEPALGSPGEYRASLIPTRPGTYTFHVTGSVGGQALDETFTSGEQTFDDVREAAGAEFPAQDPSRGELAERLDRLDARLQELPQEVAADVRASLASGEAADEDGGSSVLPGALSILAVVLGAAALVVALVRGRAAPGRLRGPEAGAG